MTDKLEQLAELERIGIVVAGPSGTRREWVVRLGDRLSYVLLTHTAYGFWICQDRERVHDGRGESPLKAYATMLRGCVVKAHEAIAASEAELARIGAEVTP